MISMVSKEGGGGRMYVATISLDSSIKRAVRGLPKEKTTITFPICNLFHLWVQRSEKKAKTRRLRGKCAKNPGVTAFETILLPPRQGVRLTSK
jgi:hypothetical protein